MNRIIFFHIPKTAGNSIYASIKDDERVVYVNHNTWDIEWKHLDKYSRTDAFIFAFVRNPWERLASSFFYLTEWYKGAANKNEITEAKGNFEKFVLGEPWNGAPKRNLNKVIPHLLPQYKWLVPEVLVNRSVRVNKDHLLTNFVGKYENLHDDLSAIAQKTGLNFDTIKHYNTSNHLHYKNYYTTEMIDIVAEVYKTDIELFDYNF